MKKQFNTSQYDVPKTLSDHPFFGLQLDPEQIVFRDAIWNPNNIVTLCNARSGSGKSLIAVATAVLLVKYGLYNGITYICFPTMEQKQGFIPGDPDDKNAPYMQPLIDALMAIGEVPMQVIKSSDNMKAVKDGSAYITFTSDTYMRGINLEKQVIIIDETQNGYIDQCKKVFTRIHDNSKVIVIGHTLQSDLFRNKEKSGFAPYLSAFTKYKMEHPEDERVEICELKTNHRGWFSTFCDNVEIYL